MADGTNGQAGAEPAKPVDVAMDHMKLEEILFRDEDVQGGRRAQTRSSKAVLKESLVLTASRSPSVKHERSTSPDSVAKTSPENVDSDSMAKPTRKPVKKELIQTATLYDHLEDATPEATGHFQVIKDCIYGSKHMGSSEHDALDCDCAEEYVNGRNHACGEDSDCINRATKMECVNNECNCGPSCQNQRFQQKHYADVSVIRTEKKGYGLRVNTALQPNDFIFEYIGEVINEATFRRRMIQYDDEGIKHFYFMSLTKSEFVDATKKGNLGRFCNHSCNPNCYVDKWVVGEKLRMGIFAERHIKAGEELVFNYNVDRYGADPQPCYCGEPNCTGYIGGKTQTERATKLSHATIEALGIDDGDGWDTAVARKPRKKKAGEDDEEYVNNLTPRQLDEEGVRKVMATLMQCKEKWIVVKLLSRIQRCGDERVRHGVVRMHGYQILRTTLTTWREDDNVVLQILDILYKLPRLTRNKINDAKIEPVVESLAGSEHEDVASESKRLIEEWGKLEVAYRIPRKKFDPNAQPVFERRESERVEVATPSPVSIPTGPRNAISQRPHVFGPPRPHTRRPIPPGWFTAQDDRGHVYYYSRSGQTTWQRPHQPPVEVAIPKGPPKSVQNAKALQDIIDSIIKVNPNALAASQAKSTPPVEAKPTEKWRAYPEEKQMKLWENTLSPHIRHVMQKYAHKLPKDDLKRLAKQCGKTLVASDFKNKRIEDPTKISEKQEKKVKKYVKTFFDRAVEKKKAIDAKKKERDARREAKLLNAKANGQTPEVSAAEPVEAAEEEIVVDMSDMEDEAAPDSMSSGDKRKREEGTATDADEITNKRLKSVGDGDDDVLTPSTPPPPPPPPPVDGDQQGEDAPDEQGSEGTPPLFPPPAPPYDHEVPETEEQRDMRRQEEELVRENEEAAKWEESRLQEAEQPIAV